MKFKPLLAVATCSVGVMAFASPAMALPGDDAVLRQAPFRLNPTTLEPGCFIPGRGNVDLDSHIDLTSLADGDIVRELHVTVRDGAAFSVDQVLVPSATDGYKVYSTFDTGTSGTDPDVDPNQTAVDLFAPAPGPLDRSDVIVCISDHNDDVQNEPYVSEAGGLVAAVNRPIIQPMVSCIGASAIEPLNTYKAGFGYSVTRTYLPSRFGPVTDPNARDTNGDGVIDAVRLNPREDGAFDAHRVNDMDSASELYSGDQADYGQTRLFSLAGDATAWTLSNNNDPDSLAHLVTFTAQGDLPLTWTLRASLAQSSSKRSVTLTDAQLRAWEASWQSYYDGGVKPTMSLCPGTNSPAPDTTVVVNLPQQAAPTPAPAAAGQVTIREVTTVQTAAGPTVYVKQPAAKKSSKAAKKAAKRASCLRKAKTIKSATKRHRAVVRCRK
jgi:hypothetical protein